MYKLLIIKGEADSEAKRCYDCRFCQGALTWWCTNETAVEVRRTKIPGIKKCPYWEAALHVDDLPKSKSTILSFIFGLKDNLIPSEYIGIDCSKSK